MNKIIQEFFYFNNKLLDIYKTFNNFYDSKQNQFSKQIGGYSIEYHNDKIKFDKVVDDDLTTLYVSTLDKHSNCILILIYKDNNTAILQGISSDKCFKNPEFNNGKHLMTITIKFLKKYSEKFNIKYIELTDNSYIDCNHKDIKIWLADLSQLQYNDTFYGKFGFVPNKKIDYNNYKNNRNILKKLLTKEIDLKEIIVKSKDYSLGKAYTSFQDYELNKELLKIIHTSYQEYEDKLFIEWFLYISKILMKKNCHFFEYFIDKLYKVLQLSSLAHKTFILNLS